LGTPQAGSNAQAWMLGGQLLNAGAGLAAGMGGGGGGDGGASTIPSPDDQYNYWRGGAPSADAQFNYWRR
jgi:hypothetical protein